MAKHILQENYERFFGPMQEENDVPQEIESILVPHLKKVGLKPGKVHPSKGTVYKDPGDLATTIEFDDIETWNTDTKALVSLAIKNARKENRSIFPIRLVNGLPKYGKKAFLVVTSEPAK